MNKESVPSNLALIPDGNRRWAKMHRLSVQKGYKLGVNKFLDFAEWCSSYGIYSITVWALSSENVNRPKHEVNALFTIYKKVATDKKILERLHKNKTRLNIVANEKLLPKDVLVALKKLETKTRMHKDRVINMLLGYGGKDDILHAAKIAALKFKDKGQAKFEDLFAKSLISSGIPDLDFIIRTSGEQRLSGFMPWQSNYSELYFSKKLWPDFTRRDLRSALTEYKKRQRRFGR
jgi:undecaprenyl diphosphate synthase